MRSLLVFALTFALAFSAQMNTLAGGAPVALDSAEDRYVVAAGGLLYVFDSSGNIENYKNIGSISDFSISGDTILVTTTAQTFPNIRAYSFPGLQPRWEFEPKMDVFDISLVWTEKQTRSWSVHKIPQGFGVTSGYTFYTFSTSGEPLGNFSAKSDIWDFAYSNTHYYLATQEGKIYVLDADLNPVEELQACDDYELIDRVSNRSLGTYSRSAWDVNGNLAACEDGHVFFMDSTQPQEFREYSNSQLYTYYYQNRRESGVSSSMFENLKVKEEGDFSVVYSSDKVSVFRKSELVWSLDKSISALDISEGNIHILSVSRQGIEKLSIYSLEDGTLAEEDEFKSLSCQNPKYEILAGDKTLIASSCEIKLVDGGNVVWYLPRADSADFEEYGEFRVYYMDDAKNMHDKSEFYSLLAMNGSETLWTYRLPEDMARKGKMNDVEILGSSGNVVVSYSSGDDDRLIVIDMDDGASTIRNASSRIYAGNLDRYMLNETIVEFAEDFNYGLLDMIPDEFKYEGEADLGKWDSGTVMAWLQILNNLPVSARAMDGIRNVVDERSNYMMRTRIEMMDSCDYNGDGYEDLVVSGESFFTILNGTDMEELVFKDRETWRYYDNPLNSPNASYFIADWYDGGIVVCPGDMSGDGNAELISMNYDGNLSLIYQHNSNLSRRWTKTYKNLNWNGLREIEDYDGDGNPEILISQWVENNPDNMYIISSWDGRQLHSFSSYEFFLRENVGDIDGDGVSEDMLLYDQEGAVLTFISPGYKFEYTGFRDLWEAKDRYGRVFPADVIPDINDNGYGEIIVGISRRWGEPAMMLLVFDGENQEIIKRIEVEGNGDELNNDEWQYIPEMKRFGDYVSFNIPPQEGSSQGKFAVYNFVEDRMELYVNEDVKKVVDYGDGVKLIGLSGEVFVISGEDVPEPEVTSDGSVIHVESDEDYYTQVYVDRGIAASGRAGSFDMRIANGDHRVVVSLQNEEGLQKLFTHQVSTFTSSDLSFLNKIIIGLAIVFGGFKVAKRWL